MLMRRRLIMASSGPTPGTWEDLFRAINAGTYASEYSVGDTFLLDLGTEGEIHMEIVKFDGDVDENGATVPVTLIGVELLTTSHRFNPALDGNTSGTGNIGGWPASELRTYMNSTIYDLIPAAIKSHIKTVKKYSQGHTDASTNSKNLLSTDKIWCPSFREIASTNNNTSNESSGVSYYPETSTAAWRKKTKWNSNTYVQWWSRSGYKDDASQALAPSSSGSISSGYIKAVTNSYGIAIGFCVGGTT